MPGHRPYVKLHIWPIKSHWLVHPEGLFEDPDGIRLEINFVPGKGLLT
jgi:hypothetical protein